LLNIEKKAHRKSKISAERLRDILERRPDLYLQEIAEEFGCTSQAVCSALKRNRLTRKKTFTYSEKSGEIWKYLG
jgi:predicted transcriptional regulator